MNLKTFALEAGHKGSESIETERPVASGIDSRSPSSVDISTLVGKLEAGISLVHRTRHLFSTMFHIGITHAKLNRLKLRLHLMLGSNFSRRAAERIPLSHHPMFQNEAYVLHHHETHVQPSLTRPGLSLRKVRSGNHIINCAIDQCGREI